MSQTDDQTRKQQREAARAERKAQEEALARAATRKRRLGIIGGVVALAAVIAVILVVVSSPDDAETPTAAAGEAVAGQTETAALLDGIPQNGRALGDPDAPVTLVEFADLQCPFCRDFSRDALPTIVRDYVRTGRVRIEFRPRTFLGEDSLKAAGVAVAAGRQDKLWNTVELLYANQGAENSGWVTDELLRDTLTAAGADADEAITGATSAGVQRSLEEADLLATRNGLDSTPSFLVGPTGGELEPLQVEALTGEAFAAALDRVVPAS